MIIYSKLFSHKKVHRVARFNPFPAVLPSVFRGPQNTILRKRFFIQLFFVFAQSILAHVCDETHEIS